jgi:hypothetical protein
MTYDQAQSPRLGQRVPIESTYVQIFDVDPATPTADLVEAAWPGQLIYRNDLGILQIYDGIAHAWRDVGSPGGAGGSLTYVGPDMPVGTFNLGDQWYDTDDGYRQWVWAGSPPSWQNPNAALETAISGNADAILANQGLIGGLTTQVNENNFLAVSANNSADTADGRVSMSDYLPGDDDVTYKTMQDQLDPVTGLPGPPIEVELPRQNGSIWFVRTRPRNNLCVNPSLETDSVGWSSFGATIVRDNALVVPVGDWTLKVSNTASGVHGVAFGTTARITCVEGKSYYASVYAELISAVTPPTVILEIVWHDSAGAVISTTSGDPYTLIANAFAAAQMGTIAEPRVSVSGVAPVGAVTFFVQEICSGDSLDWHTGALLVEKEDDLGRYFDGDSYDGSWDGTAHASASRLKGDKIQEIWELRDGKWIQKFLTTTTLHDVGTDKLVGPLDGQQIANNTISPDKMGARTVRASANLAAGDLVNIWNNSGVFEARKASASSGYQAHGFVMDSCLAGLSVRVYHMGYNTFVSGLSPGNQFLSSVAGKSSGLPASGVGSMVQKVGFAPAPDVLNFQPAMAIRVT